MSLSALAKSIAESPTLKLNEEAQKLRERGEAVCYGVGEPKNKGPTQRHSEFGGQAEHGRHQVFAHRRHSLAEKSNHPLHEENYDRIVRPDNVIRLVRREAVDLQPAVYDFESAGRGDCAGAVLGELPGNDQDVLGRAGGGDAGGRTL